jgi:ubiquitin-activating enzyme E1-like protein 2
MDCVEYARMKFEKLFNHSAKQLIHVYPLDAKTKENNLFWSLPKRPPTPVEFDKDSMLHCSFINAIFIFMIILSFLRQQFIMIVFCPFNGF